MGGEEMEKSIPRRTAAAGEALEREAVSSIRLEQLESRGARYEHREPLGKGGMGEVDAVWDSALGRILARKRLRPETRVPHATERFLEEAQITGRLEHPGIVPVHELAKDNDGQPFFTMRRIRGRSLKELIERAGGGDAEWTRERLLGVLLRTCETMSYAHAKGVLHRDLKPANIMVGKFGETYVVDWGLGRIVGREDVHDLRLVDASGEQPLTEPIRIERAADEQEDSPIYTMDGDVVGTPAFMSPEAARGQVDRIDETSDIYSLGATLYNVLAGTPPFVVPNARQSARTVLARLLHGPPDPLPVDVPAELVAICEKAMQRDPSARYASMSEFGADLRAYLEGRVVRAHRVGPWPEFAKWMKRNRLAAGLLAALAVTIAASAVFEARQSATLARVLGETSSERDSLLADQLLGEWAAGGGATQQGIASDERWLARCDELLDRSGALLAGVPDSRPSPREDLLRARTKVAARLERERAARTLSLVHAADEWEEARRAIRESARYGGLDLPPQFGLVPLREDPRTHLWEFWHPYSGERPALDPERDSWVFTEDTGLVFVLIPGGTFQMGSPADEPGHAAAEALHEETVAPYFLAKTETTQAQVLRAGQGNPSEYPPGTIRGTCTVDGRHPLESLSHTEATWLAQVNGLRLPTEIEWEYACRAGGSLSGAWAYGSEPSALEGRANVADASYSAIAGGTNSYTGPAPWDDGFPLHAPVASFPPDAFGLHDLMGNVGEWTASVYSREHTDGATEHSEAADLARSRIVRGGNWYTGPFWARVALRQPVRPGNRQLTVGVRFARDLTAN